MRQVLLLIKRLNLTNSIDIIGPVDNSKLFKYYQTHNIYLNTTSYESYGVAVMEAASCGIPIVSTSVGELPYLWCSGTNIILIDNLDEIKMAAAVNSLLSSNELCDKLSKNARLIAENYDWDSVKNKWMKLLND